MSEQSYDQMLVSMQSEKRKPYSKKHKPNSSEAIEYQSVEKMTFFSYTLHLFHFYIKLKFHTFTDI